LLAGSTSQQRGVEYHNALCIIRRSVVVLALVLNGTEFVYWFSFVPSQLLCASAWTALLIDSIILREYTQVKYKVREANRAREPKDHFP
jgi:hypothetical protein